MKKTLIVIAALAALLLILCCGAALADADETGECGPNLTYKRWGTCIELIGTGPMYDYPSADASPFGNRSDITLLKLGLAETVGSHAFEGCTNLDMIKAYNEIRRFNDYAFFGCTKLSSMGMGHYTEYIGYMAFAGTNLVDHCVYEENPYIQDVGGVLYNSDCTTLIHFCKGQYGLTEYTIPATVTRIEAGAFYNAQQTITFEDISTLREVGDYAFYNCPNLVAELPASLHSLKLGKYAFYNCSGITGSVRNARDIGDYTFYNCTGLTGSVTIGDDAGKIGRYAFYGCSGLSGPITLGDNCGSIGDYAFYGCTGLTGSVPVGEECSFIGDYAFYGCAGLSGVLVLPDAVNEVQECAFAGCSGLTGVVREGGNNARIGNEAFLDCTGLKNINIISATSIGTNAFKNCTALESASLPEVISYTLGDSAFSGCVSLKNISVPYPKAGQNGGYAVPTAFAKDCSMLETAYVSVGATEIKSDAFSGCSALATVWLPADMRIIRQGAFRGCAALTDVYYGGTEDQWEAVTLEADNGTLVSDNVTVHFESEYPSAGKLIIEPTDHGTITMRGNVDFDHCTIGKSYLFYAEPDPGYHLAQLHARGTGGRDINISYTYLDQSNRKRYAFQFGSPTITLSAVFEQDYTSQESSPYQLTSENMPLELTDGWYELTESVTLNNCLVIEGNVSLYVDSGVTLNCRREGIEVKEGNSLTISGNGTINANGTYHNAGIGGSESTSCGTVIINGCTINASCNDSAAAGIGGGSWSDGGTIIINGGVVNATGHEGPGIGGGPYPEDNCCSVIINGGTVTATSREFDNIVYSAIGCGADIEIADGLMVTVIGGETPALYDGRIEACAARGVRIEACDHSGEILLDNGGHMICRRCGLAVSGDEVGDGSAANPWRIGSEDEWNALAQSLENGLDTSGKHFRLTNDISVTAMIGSADHPFRGALNGAGHTLTFTAADAPNDCAPLRYIENAEISNLRIAGTIQTDNRWAAGLAANALGACRITNCRSSVAITSSHDDDGSHGGFVSVIAEGGSLTMNGCLFDGAITGADTTHCGGFVAYARNSVIIRNSLCAPSAYDTADSMNFARWASGCSVTIENSYYTDIAADDQGQYGYPVTAGEGVTLDFGLGTTYSVSGLTAYPAGLAYGGVFRAGTGDTVTLTAACELAAEGAVIRFAASSGTLRLVDAGYQLTLADGPSVISATFDCLFEGSGTPDDPWKIGSADDWDALASNDIDTAGKHFLLTEDIPVTTMLGVGGNRFKGCFDGNGHTLTVDLSAATAAAPFYAINGATIRNLRVTGAVSGGIHSAGLVAGANGVNLIENCAIGVRVACSGSHCGGVIGHGGASDTTLRGCVFTGSTSGATRVGTLWGWSDSGARPTIEYCLDVSDSPYPIGLGYDDPSNDLVCVYYTNAQKEAGVSRPWRQPGKQAHTITADESVTIYLGDGDTYSVSGITTCGGNAVLYYNGVYYAGQDDIMGIFIEPAQGYMRPVAVSAGTLAERAPGFCFLTMPDADVRISATPVSIFEDAGFRLPAGLAQIEAEAFEGAAMTVVDVPATCVSIGDHAFKGCESLTLIRIPAGCALGQDVFDGCDRVYVFGAAGSPADIYCQTHDNCEFVEEMQN